MLLIIAALLCPNACSTVRLDMFTRLDFDLAFSTQNDKPVPGVDISIRVDVNEKQGGELYQIGASDGDGRFRQRTPWGWEQVDDPTIAHATLILSATKPGYEDVQREIPFTELTKVGGFYKVFWEATMKRDYGSS